MFTEPQYPQTWAGSTHDCEHYGGISSQCKKAVLSQSHYMYKHRLLDPGITFMPFALYALSLDVSDLEASQKRCDYQQPIAVRPTDKPMLMASLRNFERDSFGHELYHLRELGTSSADPEEVQYQIGTALFSNYPDISHKWSRLWSEASEKSMQRSHARHDAGHRCCDQGAPRLPNSRTSCEATRTTVGSKTRDFSGPQPYTKSGSG